MKVTINGVTYEGTEDEIRRIVENPPNYWETESTTPIQSTRGRMLLQRVQNGHRWRQATQRTSK